MRQLMQLPPAAVVVCPAEVHQAEEAAPPVAADRLEVVEGPAHRRPSSTHSPGSDPSRVEL